MYIYIYTHVLYIHIHTCIQEGHPVLGRHGDDHLLRIGFEGFFQGLGFRVSKQALQGFSAVGQGV